MSGTRQCSFWFLLNAFVSSAAVAVVRFVGAVSSDNSFAASPALRCSVFRPPAPPAALNPAPAVPLAAPQQARASQAPTVVPPHPAGVCPTTTSRASSTSGAATTSSTMSTRRGGPQQWRPHNYPQRHLNQQRRSSTTSTRRGGPTTTCTSGAT